MKTRSLKTASLFAIAIATITFLASCAREKSESSSSATQAKHRVIASTDIGGTDFDDFQSMVHMFLYADLIDLEGIIASPYGEGRAKHILQVIEHYETDYPNLKTYSDDYPTPDELRAITKQGELLMAPYEGYREPTEGSEWIIQCARRDDPRPLHILVWGGLEDLAQALHDAPDILPKLRVHYVGGPNKKWSPDAYQYLADHHKDLFFIESNSTYRGWFVGGNQEGDLAIDRFVPAKIAGHGAMGEFFASGIEFGGHTRIELKMGDTPTLGWVLGDNDPSDPTAPGWGGQFVRAWDRPHNVFNRITTAADEIDAFSIMEFRFEIPQGTTGEATIEMEVENQNLRGYIQDDGTIRVRFCPKAAKVYSYTMHSSIESIDGQKGQVTATLPPPSAAEYPSSEYPNWWTDDPDPAHSVGPHQGAETVSRWREDFLNDFAERILRCETPNPNS